jgi:uncharacterized protein YfiM (DUF2279 family)
MDTNPSQGMIPPDVPKHVIVSAALTTSSYMLFKRLHVSHPTAWSATFAISVGILKEVYDSRKPNNYFSGKDIVSDVAGITLVTIPLRIAHK